MKKLLLASVCVASIAAATSANATVVLTGSELAGVTLSVPATSVGDTGSATYNAGQITLTSGNNVTSFFDTAEIDVPNGLDGVSLGTLNNFLASGSSFNLVSMGPAGVGAGLSAYWNVVLSNGIQINSFGDNVLGANVIDSGQGTSVSSSPELGGWVGETWAAFAATYGSLNVTDVSIDVGGWCNSSNGQNCGAQTAVINSITLPGTFDPPAAVPEPASLAMFGTALFGIGFLGFKRRQKQAA